MVIYSNVSSVIIVISQYDTVRMKKIDSKKIHKCKQTLFSFKNWFLKSSSTSMYFGNLNLFGDHKKNTTGISFNDKLTFEIFRNRSFGNSFVLFVINNPKI